MKFNEHHEPVFRVLGMEKKRGIIFLFLLMLGCVLCSSTFIMFINIAIRKVFSGWKAYLMNFMKFYEHRIHKVCFLRSLLSGGS